ncbi:MAG: class I SAM-dependent methyltransferase [Gemmatimonadetes bacterium]|nr:class I SAM-dependent methyltransferase [Gemmatimonadota bacterium]
MNIRESYDAAASGYADALTGELAGKPLDRHLLDRFAEGVAGRGPVADLGCGPGHVAQYLHERGVDVRGLDLSPGMITAAGARFPEVPFAVGDMRDLPLEDASLGGAVLFYAIVHFVPEGLTVVFKELNRVLRPDALALISFHVGEGVVHRDEMFGARVNLDFYFHGVEPVTDALLASGLAVIENTLREPYEGAEYPSRRCYLLVRKVAEPA